MFCFGTGVLALLMFLIALLKVPLLLSTNILLFLILSAVVLTMMYFNRHKHNSWTLYDQLPLKASQRPGNFAY